MNKSALFALIAPVILLIAGCAKSPPNATIVTGKQIVITMTVAGEINPNYHYFVAFDTTGTPTPGPLPVVASPWGNGWGTGNITSYIVYDAVQPQGGYGIYTIQSGTNLLGNIYIGPPISSITPPAGANKIEFTIDLGQLATLALPADQINTVNINFITTDVIPVDPNFPGPKYYDGLGETGNSFITIPILVNQRYTNAQTAIERAGDTRIPDLDIIDWSVEVQGR